MSVNSSMKPISVSLKQVFMVLIVIGFIYQGTLIYKDATIKNKTQTDKWEDCLHNYVTNICTPRGKKDTIKDQKACEDAYECLHRGIDSPSLMELGSEATKQTGMTLGVPALAGVMLYRMI